MMLHGEQAERCLRELIGDASRTEENPVDQVCRHRGSQKRTQKSRLCGCRNAEFAVFGCDLFCECSLKKMSRTIKSCASCERFSE